MLKFSTTEVDVLVIGHVPLIGHSIQFTPIIRFLGTIGENIFL